MARTSRRSVRASESYHAPFGRTPPRGPVPMSDSSAADVLDLDYLPRLPRDKQVGIGCIGAGFIMADCHLVAYRQAGFNSWRSRRAPDTRAKWPRAHGIARDTRHLPTTAGRSARGSGRRRRAAGRAGEVIGDDRAPRRSRARHAGAKAAGRSTIAEAARSSRLCESAGIVLAVNQNMRYDQSVRACKNAPRRRRIGRAGAGDDRHAGHPALDALAARLGWVTLRIMSIHHLDTFRFWFGDPLRVMASVRPDPRTAEQFAHQDGICLYILEYADGLRAAACDDVWTGPAARERPQTSAFAGAWKEPRARPEARSAGRPIRGARPSTLDFTTTAPRPAVALPALERGLVSRRLCRPDGRIAGGARRKSRKHAQRPRQSADDGPGRSVLSIGGRTPCHRFGRDCALTEESALRALPARSQAPKRKSAAL